CMRGLEFPFTF
nr:immunoglobulin light chain junction region [Macaca mulatta]